MESNVKRALLVFAIAALMAIPVICPAADDRLFDKLDTNKDGIISKDELMKNDLVIVTGKDGTRRVQHRDLVEEGEAAALTEEQSRRLFESIDHENRSYINRKAWSRASPDGFILWKF